MADLFSDIGDAFNKIASSGAINDLANGVNKLLNPSGSTNGGTNTVGGIPITASLDPGTKSLLTIFILLLIALIVWAIFK